MLSSFISVDTETTGLDHEHDRIIELAAVRFENGVPVATFTALLPPGERTLSPVARLITGITDEELASAPAPADTLRDFLAFAGDSPLVAHNAEFDAHFVRRALEAEGLPAVSGPWIDSLLLSRIAWPTWDSHRLDSLAERLAIPRDEEHRALPDARRAGHLFIAAQKHLRASLSPEGRNHLACLAADLPDWKLVFADTEHAGGGNAGDAVTGGADGKTSGSSGDHPAETPGADATSPAEHPGGFVTDASAAGIAHEAARVLATHLDALVTDEAWLALETPPDLDEAHTALAGVLAHLAHAGAGQRILLAVPDTFAWNTLRKNLPASGVKVTALAEPSGYLCRSRLAELVAAPTRVSPGERAALLPLVAWADRVPGGAMGPVADGRGFSPERARLTWARVQCDTWSDDPAAHAAYDAAASSDLILVTHATLCAHVAREGALLPPCDAVVVTGAHRYPDVAQSPAGAGRVLSLFRLREILALTGAPTREDDAGTTGNGGEAEEGGLWKDLSAALRFAPDRELQKFLQKAGKQALKSGGNDFRVRYREPLAVAWGADPEPVRDALRAHEDFLARALSALETRPDALALTASLRRVAARLRAFGTDFAFLTEAAEPESVYWLEDGANPYKTTLRAVPRDMESFGDTLRALFGAGLLLSPVVLAGGSTERDARPFLRMAGLQASPDTGAGAVPVRRFSGPDVSANGGDTERTSAAPPPLFVMAPFAPAPRAGEEMQAYARFLVDAAWSYRDHGVLVFCPSQTAVRALHAALRSLFETRDSADGAAASEGVDKSADKGAGESAETAPRVYAQWIDGNRDAITRLYAAGRGGFVIASEGLPGLRDADGRAPALWLLTRMPLPPPRDPILEARGEPLREEGRNVRAELWQPAAVLRVKREWALLHREGAQAPRAIWLLDARASTEGLGARLGEALGLEARTAPDAEALRNMTQAHTG